MIETPRVPLEPGQPVLLGIGPAGHEQWSRTLVARIEPLNPRTRVARLVEASYSDTWLCEIGVALVGVPQTVRERIIRYALGVQRDRRRRGML